MNSRDLTDRSKGMVVVKVPVRNLSSLFATLAKFGSWMAARCKFAAVAMTEARTANSGTCEAPSHPFDTACGLVNYVDYSI